MSDRDKFLCSVNASLVGFHIEQDRPLNGKGAVVAQDVLADVSFVGDRENAPVVQFRPEHHGGAQFIGLTRIRKG